MLLDLYLGTYLKQIKLLRMGEKGCKTVTDSKKTYCPLFMSHGVNTGPSGVREKHFPLFYSATGKFPLSLSVQTPRR